MSVTRENDVHTIANHGVENLEIRGMGDADIEVRLAVRWASHLLVMVAVVMGVVSTAQSQPVTGHLQRFGLVVEVEPSRRGESLTKFLMGKLWHWFGGLLRASP